MRPDHVEVGVGVGNAFTIEILEAVVSSLAVHMGRPAERVWAGILADQGHGIADRQLAFVVVKRGELCVFVLVVDQQAGSLAVLRRQTGDAGDVDRSLALLALELAHNLERLEIDAGCKTLADRTTDQNQRTGEECRSHEWLLANSLVHKNNLRLHVLQAAAMACDIMDRQMTPASLIASGYGCPIVAIPDCWSVAGMIDRRLA